jgi:hypothetical protein
MTPFGRGEFSVLVFSDIHLVQGGPSRIVVHAVVYVVGGVAVKQGIFEREREPKVGLVVVSNVVQDDIFSVD